ncbi:MAG TPA: Rrf2 family transcriptional regulator [Phycisphaerae bacterium]|jgi:Rrf2 family protein|nr:Rrf2 family transcriptional regulator [Phycisphaerae bacterium]
MQLSKRTQYGLRAVICLADAYERGYLQTKELASREKLPTKFLESILSALTRGKYLTSKIGATGGYRLARPPREIVVADIVARLEGKKLMEEPEAEPVGGTERPGEIAVRIVQAQLSEAVRQVLQTMTLQQLAEQVGQQNRSAQMFYI